MSREVRLIGYTSDSEAEFEITNPTSRTFHYPSTGGYPLWTLQVRDQEDWRTVDRVLGCYYGITQASLAPHGSQKFVVPTETWAILLDGDVSANFRAGLCLYPSSALRRLAFPDTSRRPGFREIALMKWDDFQDRLFGAIHERSMVWSDPITPPEKIVRKGGDLRAASAATTSPPANSPGRGE